MKARNISVTIFDSWFLGVLAIIFVVAKLWDKVDWPWWLVLLPVWIVPAVLLVIAAVVLITGGLLMCFLHITEAYETRRNRRMNPIYKRREGSNGRSNSDKSQ
jgi:hypothetical protein